MFVFYEWAVLDEVFTSPMQVEFEYFTMFL